MSYTSKFSYNKSRKQNQDTEWSFSCRSAPCNPYSDSDDSDLVSDAAISGLATNISEETRLMNDLDLSTREETVQYRPNPFSIAKINAASRSIASNMNSTKSQAQVTANNYRTSNPPDAARKRHNGKNRNAHAKTRRDGNILDGFRKQSQKAAFVSQLDSCPKASSTAHAALQHLGAKASRRLVDSRASNSHFASAIPEPETIIDAQLAHISPQERSPVRVALQSQPHVSPRTHTPTIIDPSPADLHHVSLLSQRSAVLYPGVEDIVSNETSCVQDLNSDGAHDDGFSSSSLILPVSPSFSSYPELNLERVATRRMPTIAGSAMEIQNERSSNSTAGPRILSSTRSSPPPCKAAWDTFSPSFSHRSKPIAISSPLRPPGPQLHSNSRRVPNLFHPNVRSRLLGPPFSYEPAAECFDMIEPSSCTMPGNKEHDKNQRPFTPSRNCAFVRKAYASSPVAASPLHGTIRRESPFDTDMTIDTKGSHPSAHSLSLPASSGESVPRQTKISTLETTIPQGSCDYPLIPSSIVYYPTRGAKRRRHDLSSPATKTNVVKVRPKDAYDCLTLDQDEEWSSLSSKKKAKPSTLPARTAKFRMPKLSHGTVVRKTGMEANSAQRVITFLPPPLKASPMEERDDKAPHAIPTKSRTTYPSPVSTSPFLSSSSPSAVQAPQSSPNHQIQVVENIMPYMPLSPPSSDPLIVASPEKAGKSSLDEGTEDREKEKDIHAPIDLASIARLYPDIKAKWRERRRRSEEVWDLLGLPSCGHVYTDASAEAAGSGGSGIFEEIGIVQYNG
ncbi:hypothetical protein H0H92_002865 [Tricholoma furcatifolium]|nr:hypothetical protein H0H92_002865 [Tricholoma furcatifolium]